MVTRSEFEALKALHEKALADLEQRMESRMSTLFATGYVPSSIGNRGRALGIADPPTDGAASMLKLTPSAGKGAFLTAYDSSLHLAIGSASSHVFEAHANGVEVEGTLSTSGKLGVGITSPNAELHIAGAGDANNPALQIGGSTTYRLGMYTTAEGGVLENRNGDDGLQFRTKTVGEAMRILSASGNVGVGTAAPSTRLSVVSNSANGIELGQDLDDADDSGRLFFSSSAGVYSIFNDGGDLRFNSGGTVGSSSGTQRLTLSQDGTVRVGGAVHPLTTDSWNLGHAGARFLEVHTKHVEPDSLRFTGTGVSSADAPTLDAGSYLARNYGLTSTSGGAGIVDTGILASAGLYEVTVHGNPNNGGSHAYVDYRLGYVTVSGGYNGAVGYAITYHSAWTSGAASGEINQLSVSAVFYNAGGGYETSFVPIADGSNHQIRIKVAGYTIHASTTVGSGQKVRILRRA